MAFIRNRVNVVELRGADGMYWRSRGKKSTAGVPRGSSLGPIIFALYVNSLLGEGFGRVGADVWMYADDVVVMAGGEKGGRGGQRVAKKRAEQALEMLEQWAKRNEMVFDGKTSVMKIGGREEKGEVGLKMS